MTRSTSRGVGRSGPRSRQTPPSSTKSPDSRAPSTNSRRKRGSPNVRSDDLASGRRVDRATQHGQQQFVDRPFAERPQLDPLGRVVLPQQDHGIGSRPDGPPGGSYAGQDGCRAGLRELVDQHGRAVVEQVGVIDENQERTTAGLVEQLAACIGAAARRGTRAPPPRASGRGGGARRRPRRRRAGPTPSLPPRPPPSPPRGRTRRPTVARAVLPTPAGPVMTAPWRSAMASRSRAISWDRPTRGHRPPSARRPAHASPTSIAISGGPHGIRIGEAHSCPRHPVPERLHRGCRRTPGALSGQRSQGGDNSRSRRAPRPRRTSSRFVVPPIPPQRHGSSHSMRAGRARPMVGTDA